MKAKTSQQLYGYWNGLRAGRLAPRRFEVEPSAIASILPDTFILERADRMEYPFRLAGTRICEAFGNEFHGRNILDLWTMRDREVVIRVLESVTRDGGVGVLGLSAWDPQAREGQFEILLLPLVHTGQTIGRVLGSVAPLALPANPGMGAFDGLQLVTFDVIWPDGKPYEVLARSDTPAPFVRDLGPSRVVRADRRAFRVFDGGRKDDDLVGGKPLDSK